MNDQIFFFIKYDIRNMEEIANNKKNEILGKIEKRSCF